MVSQLFRSNEILMSFRSDFLKSQTCQHKTRRDSENFLEKAYLRTELPVARFPPGWCQ